MLRPIPPIHRRLQGLFQQHSLRLRRPARRLKRALSLLRYRLRALRRPVAPRVVTDVDRSAASPVAHAAVAVRVPPGRGDGWAERLRAGQTEDSLAVDAPEAAYWLRFDGEPESLPAALVESLLLTAAAEGLPWVAGGWTAPAPGRFGPSGELWGFGDGEPPALVRLPGAASGVAPRLIGRRVGVVTGTGPTDDASDGAPASAPWLRSGPHLLRPDVAPGAVVRRRVRQVDAVLAELPELPGPRTALFLLPFLAVGGAERLLLDLLEGLRAEYRLLVVTLEPHLEALGQRVDAVRAVTPHLYTLGDQLPREAHPGALRHLLRRYRVETLVCWNGAVDFYDLAPTLRRDFPELRILNQLYNHRGGWIERYSPALVGAVDHHLAVNRRIAEALERERGVPAERIALVHHGVRIPPLPTVDERADRRRRARERLGLPHDAVVAGTFIRLHPQKRPLDLLRLARRFAGRTDPPVCFLLAGGGPLDGAVDRELARRPLPNLLRLPMQRDVGPLYDALDLCLLTSAYEGLPIFLLDGLARGLPCVATAVGEVPELLADGGGVTVDRPGDLDALERAVEALLDPDRRRREGEAGRATVAARFGLDAYRSRYRELIFPSRRSSAEVPDPAEGRSSCARSGGSVLGDRPSQGPDRSDDRRRARWKRSEDRSKPKVSVVIPSYNHGRYVEACVRSALAAGDGVDLEVVVVDDGSTDDSLARLATFDDDPRVRLHPQENQGAHAAFNRGLDLARGEILFLLNSDDLFEPGRIPRFLDRFDFDPEVDLLTSWIRIVDGDGAELGVKEAWRNLPPWPRPHPGPGLADLGEPLLVLLESNYVATTSNVAVRRRVVEEHGLRFQPLRYTHDWDFLLAAGRHGGMAVIEEPLVRYRVHPENTLAEGRDQRGQGQMRFEVLWTVARHAAAVLRRAEERGHDPGDLRRRLHRSLPRFGEEDLLYQLLLLRGDGTGPLASYDDLLDPSHPFTRRAVEVLGKHE